MTAPSPVLGTVIGVALILAACRDVFDTLFHAEGRATLGRWAMRGVWLLARRAVGRRPRAFSFAGPVAVVTVIGLWAGLLVAGWALIYWPHLPEDFHFTTEEQGAGLIDALHVSLVTLTTLGFGDISPTADWLRLVAPLEALLGFGLLSASISWLLLLYPALSRRRSLAYELWLLRQAERQTLIDPLRLEPDAAERIYLELTSRLVAVERDLVNFPIAYYFAETDDRFSLAAVAPYVLELATRGAEPASPARVRLRATMLQRAVQDFAATTAEGFHGGRSDATPEALNAYARDHLQTPVRTPNAAARS
jgi:Ion channel